MSQGLPVGVSASFWERAVPVVLRYAARTRVDVAGDGAQVRFAPNLAREAVVFDGTIRDPLAFREAMAALHAVVVADLRHKKSDRAAYAAHRARVAEEEQQARSGARAAALADLDTTMPRHPPSDDDRRAFARARSRYWDLRARYETLLRKEDPALWRALVPCDPVCTVAPDAVLFEGFSQDGSSWGCVTVDRDGFDGAQDAQLGTTNVDYSSALHDELERLRTYRRTRLQLDPGGLVATSTSDGGLDTGVIEEKIALPSSWLLGFGQIASTLFLPTRRVRLPVTVLRELLALLRTRREKHGPRALRFDLQRGRPVAVVVEPWGARFVAEGTRYDGPRDEQIPVWGRRRLFALERLLPLAFLHDPAASVDVRLAGPGLPSTWTVRAGMVRTTLALSGWTTNDWSGALRLDLLAASATPSPRLVHAAGERLQRERRLTLPSLASSLNASADDTRAAVVELARLGQVVGDIGGAGDDVVRFRGVLDAPLAPALLGDDPPELVAGRRLPARIVRDEDSPVGRSIVATVVGEGGGRVEVEGLLDADGVLSRARCGCSYFFRFGLKKGPCRHLIAMRLAAMDPGH